MPGNFPNPVYPPNSTIIQQKFLHMGLDMSIQKIKSLSELDGEQFINASEEVQYWRKYYSLHTWFLSNCKSLNHDIIDGVIVTKENLIELLKEAERQSEGLVNDDYDLREGEDYFEELPEVINALLESQGESEYYYEYLF